MFFLTVSELSHVYKGPKSKKVYETFGLGRKYQGRTMSRKQKILKTYQIATKNIRWGV